MRPRTLLGALILLWTVAVSGQAHAVYMHNFSCKDCHHPDVSITGIGTSKNIFCLRCHTESAMSPLFLDGRVNPQTGLFSLLDQSNAMTTQASKGTSHAWTAPADVKPAAGAKAPPTTFYSSRYNISYGKVTCGRCHDPHMATTETQLLRPTAKAEHCLECHNDWNLNNNNAFLTHPVGVDYAVFAGTPGYKAAIDPTNGGVAPNGDVRLVNGTIGCGSCHGNHFADSDASTVDGAGQIIGAGDGHLLRSDGPLVTGGTPNETAQKRSNLCQACHTYKTHGNASDQIGCLDCHSGHSYNGGSPNYYILRNATTTTAYGPVSGLNYTSIPGAWSDGAGTANGYCEKCHGEVTTMVGSAREHSEGEGCVTCHGHGGETFSFEAAGGCDSCHGYPPVLNSPGGTDGYAVAGSYNYSTSGVFKDEASTPHALHADAGGPYHFACSVCHLNLSHNTGTFQDVFVGGTYHALASGNGAMTPGYDGTTCTNVYCHSNGGARTNDAGRFFYPANVPAWDNGDGTISGCSSCHGNDVDSMGVPQRNNSQTHSAHLTKGYDCSVCHNDTATSAAVLKAGTAKHVNGVRDVNFDTAYSLGAASLSVGATPYTGSTGVCAVYCHSDGNGNYQSVDWDSAAAVTCDFCHDGKVGDASVIATGAHTRHVSDPNGPQLLCSFCHGAGADSGSQTGHMDGVKTAPAAAVCNGCHGSTVGGTGNDAPPVWTNSLSVKCEICHIGTLGVIGGKTAPNKSTAVSGGHNRPTAAGAYPASGNVAANRICDTCHDANAEGHFDGITGDDQRLEAGLTCNTCHGAGGTAAKKNIVTHQGRTCDVCHDPHGTSNLYMVKGTSSEYSGTVVFTALSGANSYDEDDAADGGVSENNADDLCATCHSSASGIAHNNRENTDSQAPTGHKLAQDCFTCHKAHTDATAPFGMGAGTACNDCHGFPPASAAHEVHARTASNDKNIEDRSDCARCHTGAHLYTYDLSADNLAGRNHGDAAGRRTLLANAVVSVGYNAVNQSCSNACHKSTASDGYWADSGGLNCDACHYYAANPNGAANTADANPLTGSHNKHFGGGGLSTCSSCHDVANGGVPAAGPLAHISTGAGTDQQIIQGRAEALMNEAAVTPAALGSGIDSDPGNANCNNRACHNPSNTAYSATWTVANAAGCAFCHSGTNPNTGSHNSHMTAAATFGINTIACTSCHGTLPVSNIHRNGSVNLLAAMNYTAGAESVGGSVGKCTTTTCHNDGKATPAAVLTPDWGTASANCTICHGNAPATGAHVKHVANTVFVAGLCGDCHTAANTTSHINGSRNMANKVTSYTSANGTCANNCHLVSDGRDWTSGTKLACTDCHGSGKVTSPALDRGWAPASGAHAKHKANTSYVAANCVDCHNNNTVTHSPIDNVVTDAVGTKLSASPIDGSCTNSCHLAATAGDWTGGAAIFVCTDCHSGTYVGGGARGPSSGLHTGARITGNAHDGSFDNGNSGTATCTSCHTNAPSSAHLNGVVNASAPTVVLAATVGFIDDAVAPTCAPTGAMASCHDDGGVWKRKWNVSAKNNDGSECANCHGTFTQGFVTGMSLRHQTAASGDPDGFTASNHDGCFMCHGYKPGEAYYDFATQHRNGAIEVNNQVGFVDNGATVGCTGCHASNNIQTIDGHHGFDDTLSGSGGLSRWGRNLIAGPTGSCNDCHVSNGVGHDHPSENVSEHNAHDLSGYTAGCTDCHINSGPGPVTHNNGTVNFGGTYMSSSLDYAKGAGFGGSCAGDTNGCHNSSAGNWASGTLSGSCADCHAAKKVDGITTKILYRGGYPPTSGQHAKHLASNAYVPGDCNSCHGANAATGAHATHKNANTDTTVNYHPGDFSCDNNCHLADTNDWQPAATLSCADCHAAGAGKSLHQGGWPPVSNAHPAHVGSGLSAAYGDIANHSTAAEYEFGCGKCHGSTASAHLDGSKTVTGTGWNSGPRTCNATYCHSGLNASNVRVYATSPAWNGTFVGNRCGACHGNSPASGAHVEHQVGFHYNAIYTALKDFLPVLDSDPLPTGLVTGANGRNQLRGHGGLLDSDGTPTSTTITCYVCHNDTVTSKFNDQNPLCGSCHNGTNAPIKGNATIADKSRHVNEVVEVQFVDEKIRSKAQVRDNLFSVPELSNNWTRTNLYKKNNGSSYDEQPQTLRQMAVTNGGWNGTDKTCQISCHLWEGGRVDKYPAQWNGGAIICIDCHTRLPK